MQVPGHINSKTTGAPRGSLKTWRKAPFKDYNLALDPMVSNIALSAYDQGMLDIKSFLGGAQATIAGKGSVQTLGTVANNMVQRGTPISSAVLVLHAAFDEESSLYAIMPPRKMQVDELQGFQESTIEFGIHLPQEAAEFTTGHYLDYQTTQYAAKGFRYIQACRTGADEIHTDYGKQIWAFKILALGNNFRVLSELIILAALLNANDRYGDEKLTFGKSAQSIEDLKKRNRESGGDPSGASVLGHPGMFGILHRDKGFEWLLGWVKKIASKNSVNFTHLIITEGTLELISASERRTNFLGAGEKAQSNLNAGANLARREITAKGFTIIEDKPRTVRNASTKTINMMTSAAQVGRWLLLDNTAYWDLVSSLNSYIPGTSSFSSGTSTGNGASPGSFSMPGMGSINDLYYLNLEGRGRVERQRYAEVQKAALCWDQSTGRLDDLQYENLISHLDVMTHRLGINYTGQGKFRPDPWVVYQNGKYEIVRMIGNQNIQHTSVDDTKNIARFAASRISQLLSGTNCVGAINNMLKLMKMNYETSKRPDELEDSLDEYISKYIENADFKVGPWDSAITLPGFSTIIHMRALSKMYHEIIQTGTVLKDQARIARLGIEAIDHYTKICKQIFCVEKRGDDDSWSNFYFNPSTLMPWMRDEATVRGLSDSDLGDLAFQQNVVDHRKFPTHVKIDGNLIRSEITSKALFEQRIYEMANTTDVKDFETALEKYLKMSIGKETYDKFKESVNKKRDLIEIFVKTIIGYTEDEKKRAIAVITLMISENSQMGESSFNQFINAVKDREGSFKGILDLSDDAIKGINNGTLEGMSKYPGKSFSSKQKDLQAVSNTHLCFKNPGNDYSGKLKPNQSEYDEFFTERSGSHWNGRHYDHAAACNGNNGRGGRGTYSGIGLNIGAGSSMFGKTAPKRSILGGYASGLSKDIGIDVGYLPNRHFREREKSLTVNEYENWAFSTPFRLLTGAEPTSKLMCELHAHGIPQPMTLIIMDPHINFRMNAMVFCTRGGQQGTSQSQRLNYCLAQSSLTTDNDIRHISLSVTTWIMAVVNPKNVLIIPHASFESYQSGGNGELVIHIKGIDDRHNERYTTKGCWDPRNPTESTGCRFVAYGGGSLTRRCLGDVFSIYGSNNVESLKLFSGVRIPDGVLSDIRENEMSYPSAILVNIKAGFYALNDDRNDAALLPENFNALKDYPQGSRKGCFNGWVCLGNQWQTDVTTGRGSTRKYDGVGPLGKLGPGCGKAFSGSPIYLDNKLGDSGVALTIRNAN